ncbi:MAG: efflux RND transporter periplasmic adaptor subunit [Candidatus Aegiribacteria sp.]|jgi:RND family efflux transporter MFP subunit|nr:efflux RND transporter periplasmic adaptor subunit [Candidatus Aegiribacteria sp.]
MKNSTVPVLLLLFLLFSCGSEIESDKSIPVTVIIPRPQVISETIVTLCRLESGQEAIISALTPGRVQNVLVKEGDTVSEGDILVELSTDQRYSSAVSLSIAQISAARTLSANAQADLARSERLYVSGVISETEYERSVSISLAADASVQGALAGWASARSMEESGLITASFSGTVTRIWARPGDISNGPMVSIAGVSLIQAELLLAERHLQKLAAGQPVLFSTEHYPGELFQGEVASVSHSVDPLSGLVPVIVQFHDSSELLRSGMTGSATIALETVQNAIVLPQRVLKPIDGNSWEAVLIRNGIAVTVPLETGIVNGTDFEITEGISPGDTVIALGHHLASDGDPVRVVR